MVIRKVAAEIECLIRPHQMIQ